MHHGRITDTKVRGTGARHKSKLPYHAKKHIGRLVLASSNSPCMHSLAIHMEGGGKSGDRRVVHSWAQQCTRKTLNHKVHKDSTGRTWK